MARGIKRDLRCAMATVGREIRAMMVDGSLISIGLASEGYAGGYRDALLDVLAALEGYPSALSRYWPCPNLTKEADE